MMRMDAKAIPTINTDYICHIKAIERIKPIIWGLYHTTSLYYPHRNNKVVTILWLGCDKVIYNEQGDEHALTTF